MNLLLIFTIIQGPNLPIALWDHIMVPLGFGQAILGGRDDANVYQSKIYHMKCSQDICDVLMLDKELSSPRASFVAIPMPDRKARCISESKFRYLSKIS